MLIQGPIGVEPAGDLGGAQAASKEKIWIAVETGQAADIAAGYLLAFDLTNNAAVTGIMQNTWGMRVIVYPTGEAGIVTSGVTRYAGFAETAITGRAGFASTRGPTYLAQVYGFRNDVPTDTDANTNILAGGWVVPGATTAGTVEGPADVTLPTVAELSKKVGVSFQAVAAAQPITNISCWVTCMR